MSEEDWKYVRALMKSEKASLVTKESTCNAGDQGLIPGLGISPGEGKDTHTSILAWRIPRLYRKM